MSVNRAYITSLGTTAILVASSLILLAVTSAIVAFDGWPGHSAAAAVDRVTVKIPPVAAQPVAATTAGSTTTTSATFRAASVTVVGGPGARRSAPTSAPTAPVEQPVPGDQGATAGTAPVSDTSAAQRQSSASSPPGSTPRPGDPVRQTTDAAGDSIAPVSPAGAQAVVNAGEAVATAIDTVAPPTP